MEFFDSPTFGLSWREHYIRIGVGSSGRKDNQGKAMSLPKGAIGYVTSASPASILVVFGEDVMKPPPPTSAVYGVTHRQYRFVVTFVPDDWYKLNLWLSR